MNALGVELLHGDCFICLCKHDDLDAEAIAKLVLLMLLTDSTVESLHGDLCFEHRRHMDDLVKEWVP